MTLRGETRYWYSIALLMIIGVLVACVEENDDTNVDDTIVPGDSPTATPVDPDDDANGISNELLGSEKTSPPDTVQSTIDLAGSQEEYERLWDEFRFEGDAPAVDWDQDVVIFAGTGESGTCPLELVGVEYDPDEQLVTIDVSEDASDNTPCTDDWTPRAFAISVNAEEIDDAELAVSLHHSGRGPGEIHREQIRYRDDWNELLVTDKQYPEDETGAEVFELAEDADRYKEVWEWFRMDGDPPAVDFDSKVVLFSGTGESGSCPLYLDHVKFDDEHRLILLDASRGVPEDTLCTADWTPRVFVLEMDRGHLGDGTLRAMFARDDLDEIEPDDGEVIR